MKFLPAGSIVTCPKCNVLLAVSINTIASGSVLCAKDFVKLGDTAIYNGNKMISSCCDEPFVKAVKGKNKIHTKQFGWV